MSPSERRKMIRKENTGLSLTRQCKLLKISRSSIYYTPVGFDLATIDLMHEITNGFQAKRIIDGWIGFYNSERPHTALDKRTPDAAYFCQTEIRKAA